MNFLMNEEFHSNALKIPLDERSKYLRKLAVKTLVSGKRAHLGSAMSIVEIIRVLYDDFLNVLSVASPYFTIAFFPLCTTDIKTASLKQSDYYQFHQIKRLNLLMLGLVMVILVLILEIIIRM